ncbi:MAG: 4-hydroxy-tetrahydrodipicolinate reductase [Spirochaetales bacterium]|nr:4-hydroxy-tetrahydrodipicolinate reductase [Spirochaetales bacterium]
MKIMLSGYGKMGRETEAAALRRGHVVAERVDPIADGADFKSLDAVKAPAAEAVIEFALPDGIEERVRWYAAHHIPAVIATTGWSGKVSAVKGIVEKAGAALVHGSNFAVGANLFFEIVRRAAGLVGRFPDYDVLAYELHHKRKKDSPSGTALTIGNLLLESLGEDRGKNKLAVERLDRAIGADEIHFASVRGGYIPGTHTVLFDSAEDTIEITHTVRSRAGLALGAVLAAEWIAGKKGFFEFADFMKETMGV